MELWLTEKAEQFWSSAGHPRKFPRDIERAVVTVFPVAIVRLPDLFVSTVEAWLQARGMPLKANRRDRALMGCVVAHGGKGMIFIDGTDSLAEVRYTIAHEAAHFILDYFEPRACASNKLGASATEVIDGIRPASHPERLDSLLAGVSLVPYTHFLDRGPANTEIGEIESRADRLALELLAPAADVRRLIPRRTLTKPYVSRVRSVTRSLSSHFGLPKKVTGPYASYLCRSWFSGPSFREWLGLANTPKQG